MRKTSKRVVVGTLLCTIAFSGMPVSDYGMKTIAHANEATEVTQDKIVAIEKMFVSYPAVISLRDHLEEGIDWKDCTFESSDTSVAIVNEEGVIFPLSNGSVEIMVTTKDGKKDSFPLHVTDNENVSYSLEDTYSKIGIITGAIPEGFKREELHKREVLRIADTINEEYLVKKISQGAFENIDYLEKVVLPQRGIYVEERAFANCDNLKTVIVPNMDTMFAEDAFEGDEIVLKGYEGSEAEEFAKDKDNITFEVLNPETDDYAPYEEAIYFSYNNMWWEREIVIAQGQDETIYPAVASMHYGVSDITYTSEDTDIASVENGVITGNKAGTVKITASLPSGVTRDIVVRVEGNDSQENSVEENDTEGMFDEFVGDDSQEEKETAKNNTAEKVQIKIMKKKTSLKAGKSYQFKAVALNTNRALKWSVSNKKVASINKTTGKLEAKKAGKVTVKVACGKTVKKLSVKVK